MQTIVDYVLFHFQQVYHLPHPLEISYGQDGKSRVQIARTNSNFFEQTQPQPEEITWKDWQGTSLPLFFDAAPPAEWFSKVTPGQVVVQADLIASAFFLVSGWQEFHSRERDSFGRFPYSASIQAKHRFVTKPVVNYYFDILKAALELAYETEIAPRTWNGKPFASCLTHDIDYCQSAWKVAGKTALQNGNFRLFLKLAAKKVLGKDAWFNLPEVEQKLQSLQAKGTFFFLPESKKFEGHPNADYDVSSPLLQQEIERLSKAGHEIGLHGSHGSGTNLAQLHREKLKLKAQVQGNRFHYLRFDPGQSPTLLEELGLAYDSSLGFPEHFGFRNSYCHPFMLFNFQEKRMSQTWELPLNLMDITLNHPRYLQLSPAEVLPAISPMLQEINRFHGVFTLLWHNENVSPYGMAGGLEMFQEITRHLQALGTAFLTGQEAVASSLEQEMKGPNSI